MIIEHLILTPLFFLVWIILYFAILICMTHDNFNWMSSSPEWVNVKRYRTKQYLNYIWNKRIIPVWTDRRDIQPAVISSLSLTFILFSWTLWWLRIVGIVIMILGLIYSIWRPKQYE